MAKQIALKEDVLPQELAGKYKLAEGVLKVFADGELGYIDLAIINEDIAELLAKRGYLIKISP